MKRIPFIITLPAILISACAPSPQLVQTAIAQTQAANPTMSQMRTLTPTATLPTPTPLLPSKNSSLEVVIKFIDSTEMRFYNWSFMYGWADQDEDPPEGYMWLRNREQLSSFLFLKKLSDGTKIRIGSNELSRIEMSWEQDTVSGWLVRKTMTIVRTNGERLALPYRSFEDEYCIDMSELTSKKWSQEHPTPYIYIVGNTNIGEGQSDSIEFPLFYDESVLYEQQHFAVPAEIRFSSK